MNFAGGRTERLDMTPASGPTIDMQPHRPSGFTTVVEPLPAGDEEGDVIEEDV